MQATTVPARRIAAAVVSFCALVPAPTALAAPPAPVAQVAVGPTQFGGPAVLARGPVLGGDRVLWLTNTDEGGRLDAYTAAVAPIGAATQAGSFSPTATRVRGELFGVDVGLSATRTLVAYGETWLTDPEPSTPYQVALTARPGERLAVTAGRYESGPTVVAADLDGDLLASVERSGPTSTAQLRDLTTPGVPPTPLGPAGALDVRLAGDHVAVLTAPTPQSRRVTVLERRTNATRYAVDLATTDVQLDLQAHGTIALVAGTTLSWASTADPTLHPLAQGVTATRPAIDGGRVLYRQTDGAGRAALMLARLDGAAPPYAVFPPQDATPTSGDLRDGRVAYVARGCLYVGDVPAATPDALPPGTCPPVVRPPAPRIVNVAVRTSTVRGRATARLRCDGTAAQTCEGTLTLRTRYAKGRPTRTLRTARISIPANAERVVAITAGANGLKELRARAGRRKTAPVSLVAEAFGDDGQVESVSPRKGAVRVR